jgi:predicted ArsR family transcriptional regulator
VPSTLDRRFFSTTRGRIVALLRGAARTVDELARALGVTGNAVRGHLSTLERDGLVEPRGVRRGVSKPATAYDLTPRADQLFPKAYEPVLGELLAVLEEWDGAARTEAALREVGRRLAAGRAVEGDLRARAEAAAAVLAELGGAVTVEERDGRLLLRGRSCPLVATVAERPIACRLAEALVSELVGAPAEACCELADRPRCCFALGAADPTG